MTITSTPRWSLSRGNAVVPSRWQATHNYVATVWREAGLKPWQAGTFKPTEPDARRP
jgi:hypothetical protein